METAYIGVGSNLGQKLDNCQEAISRMDDLNECHVGGFSSFYATEPVGVEDQDSFINLVVRLNTALSPETLLKKLLGLEAGMGRIRRKKWDARVIDLDILMYGSRIIKLPDLEVPHPLMHERRFVLVPMMELAPELVHPVLGKSIENLVRELPKDGQAVRRL